MAVPVGGAGTAWRFGGKVKNNRRIAARIVTIHAARGGGVRGEDTFVVAASARVHRDMPHTRRRETQANTELNRTAIIAAPLPTPPTQYAAGTFDRGMEHNTLTQQREKASFT